jgi:putative membrane protein
MSLAAERTYLAYLRTGLALVAAGVGVASALPHAGAVGVRRGLGIALVVLGTAVFIFARIRLTGVTRAMQQDAPLPPLRLPYLLTISLVAVAVTAAAVVIFA